jgi:DNA-binding CsgD family transcriptional regulator
VQIESHDFTRPSGVLHCPSANKSSVIAVEQSNPTASPEKVIHRKVAVKRVRVFPKLIEQHKREENGAKLFVFCEKTTGTTQFRAESKQADGEQTVERMAGLLAMQCLVRGHNPDDFVVLVPAEKALVGRLQTRAKQLLDQGRAVATPTTLSPRQSEILHSVICNHANKEIASKLNITVRTVKFHVSSLLNKFGVNNRAELARKAAAVLRHAPLLGEMDMWSTANDVRRRDVDTTSSLPPVRKERGFRFSSRALTA